MLALTCQPVVVRMTLRRRAMIAALYFRAIIIEFRWTLILLATLVAFAAVLHRATPAARLEGQRVSFGDAIYDGWMALLAQPAYQKCPWYLKIVYGLYPVMGFILIGEGIVRLALLMMSKRHGEKEWMRVVASTYRDHVIVCGLGHLGFRVLEQLVAGDAPTVVLERSSNNAFLSQAKAMHVPVLVRDMKEDAALIDAGVEHATSIIICSNDEMANIEVALDARRMNPKIRVVMRLFEQQLAAKISGALTIDAAFSSSALAAPVVAAMAFHTRVLSSMSIGGEPYVTAEVLVEETGALAGRSIHQIETEHAARILARTLAGSTEHVHVTRDSLVTPGDILVVHIAAKKLSSLAAAGRRG
ncbi:MAG TPA: NAD-binding protein [Tepidisphaeraceae bacterium]|nr:NAD-binding protein [Tepidisphaeraceae bacterium]